GGELRESRDDVLGELADAFAELAGAVLPGAAPAPAPAAPVPAVPRDAAALAGALRRLALELAANSFGARGAFDALRALLAGGDADAELAELGARIDRLDFASAAAKLGDLERRLGLPEKIP
ncbi:MAG TPA: hypothetical protein VFO79_05105, partial [Xanthomonadales bacterium]|nr:hypothetical protein [Xanthomonadales bacterium]